MKKVILFYRKSQHFKRQNNKTSEKNERYDLENIKVLCRKKVSKR